MGHTGTVELDLTREAVLPSKCNTGGSRGGGGGLRCFQGKLCHGDHAAGWGRSDLRGNERVARSYQPVGYT